MVAMLAVALVLGSVVVGQARERTILFVPSQTVGPIVVDRAVTASCTGGRPFSVIVDPNTGPRPVGGNCEQTGFGAPAGLVCDSPATITLEFQGIPGASFPLSAFVCHAPEDKGESQHQQHQQTAAPVTQGNEQDADSGDVDQSFEVTGGGDNSNQCPALQGVGQTGNVQDELGLSQYASATDEFEFEDVGSTIESSPVSTTTCDQQVNQAAAVG
jgi:hypothetical protein